MMRPRLLPTLALCSAACSVLLVGLLAVSWWSYPVLTYVTSDRTRTTKLLFRDGAVTLLRWGSAVNPRLGFSTDLQYPSLNTPLGHRLYHLAVGFERQDRTVAGGGG